MHLRTTIGAAALAGTFLLIGFLTITGRTDLIAAKDIVFERQVDGIWKGKTPLYFYDAWDPRHDWWFQPVPVYMSAALHTVSIRSSHAPAVIAGAANIALVFLIAGAISGTAAAYGAGLVLLFSVSHGALIDDIEALLSATFVLLWMAGVLRFLKFDSLRALLGAAVALGLYVYSHHSAPLTAVFLWMLTLSLTWRRNRVRLALATMVFGMMWLPAAAWFYWHPEMYPDTFGRWFVFKAHLRNPLDGLRAFMNPNTLGQRASLYWGFWDPSWLFLSVFPAAPLCLVTFFRARHIPRHAMLLLIGSALVVPLAGATFGLPHYIVNAPAILPILAILAGLGFGQLVALLIRRKPLEDDVAMAAVEGWHDDDALPRA